MLKAIVPTGLLKLGYQVHYDDEGRAKRYYAGLANNYALVANTTDGKISLIAFDGVAKKVPDLEQIFDFFKAAKVEKVEVSDSEQQKTSDTVIPDELILKCYRKERSELIKLNNKLTEENRELKKSLADRQLDDMVARLEKTLEIGVE